MEQTTTEKKECVNCKYYKEHYVLTGTHYLPLLDGHCINQTLNKATRKKYQLRESCEHWEENSSVKETQIASIKKVLNNMEKHLSEIRNILENIIP